MGVEFEELRPLLALLPNLKHLVMYAPQDMDEFGIQTLWACAPFTSLELWYCNQVSAVDMGCLL